MGQNIYSCVKQIFFPTLNKKKRRTKIKALMNLWNSHVVTARLMEYFTIPPGMTNTLLVRQRVIMIKQGNQ